MWGVRQTYFHLANSPDWFTSLKKGRGVRSEKKEQEIEENRQDSRKVKKQEEKEWRMKNHRNICGRSIQSLFYRLLTRATHGNPETFEEYPSSGFSWENNWTFQFSFSPRFLRLGSRMWRWTTTYPKQNFPLCTGVAYSLRVPPETLLVACLQSKSSENDLMQFLAE